MKRIITLCFVLIMVFAMCMPVSAAGIRSQDTLESLTVEKAKKYSVGKLEVAAKLAKTQKQADTVFEALLDKAKKGEISASGLSSNYVKYITSYYSGSTLFISYKIIANIPSGASIELGVRYPGGTRIPGKSIFVSNKKVGEYLTSFKNCGDRVAKQIFSSLSARGYSDDTVYKTIYPSVGKSTAYHTVSALEAAATWGIVIATPLIAEVIFPQSKIITITCKLISIGGAAYELFDSFNLVKGGLPKAKKGQYYETTTWQKNNKIYARKKVWNNKTEYSQGKSPIYDSGDYVVTALPDF